MDTENHIREELKTIAQNHGKITELASIFDVSPSTVSRWASGGKISPPLLKLLDLYFFGNIPFEISHEKIVRGVLDFTDDQYKVITILARRESTTPGKWIASKIRAYLAFDPEARNVQADIVRGRLSALPNPQDPGNSKVAEEPN
jgi:hypothetical protein